MKNYIAIDPSLNCTALVVNDKKFIYAKEEYGHSVKTGKMNKWFEICEDYITYRWTNYFKSTDHSDQEILKLLGYESVTDNIIADIINNIDPSEATVVAIEGYSYNSMAGPLIDLVTFSTLLRSKIYDRVTHDINVYQPASVKLEACKLTYPPIEKGVKVKKYEYRNYDGVAGGKFKKPEMCKCLIDNKSLQCPWVNLLREYQDDIIGLSTIPKPMEDVNDAKLLYEILKTHK